MKKQRKHSKEQENLPERINNETDLSSLPDYKFKKEVIKMLTKERNAIDRNADHHNKIPETIKRSQPKLDNSIA